MRRIGPSRWAAAITQYAPFADFDRTRGIVHIGERSAIFRRRERPSKFERGSHAGDVETTDASGASSPSEFQGLQRRSRAEPHALQALSDLSVIALVDGRRKRLLARLGMRVGHATILREVKRSAQTAANAALVRVAGIDDWAWKKGMNYGTVIVDLERRHVVDVLPDRSAASTAEWLKRHPAIEVISRDRAGLYAEGAREGAPEARQVADRFHAAFSHHLNEIPETQFEPQIPSNAEDDDFAVEMPAFEKLFDAQHKRSPTTRSTANMRRSRRLHQNRSGQTIRAILLADMTAKAFGWPHDKSAMGPPNKRKTDLRFFLSACAQLRIAHSE